VAPWQEREQEARVTGQTHKRRDSPDVREKNCQRKSHTSSRTMEPPQASIARNEFWLRAGGHKDARKRAGLNCVQPPTCGCLATRRLERRPRRESPWSSTGQRTGPVWTKFLTQVGWEGPRR
jgi:hypothetical protein